MKEIKSDLPIIPLRDVVVFPGIVTTLFVGRAKSVEALNIAMTSNKKLVLVSQKDAGNEDPKVEDIYQYASISNLLQLIKLPDGTMKVLVEGLSRANILDVTDHDSSLTASYEIIDKKKSISNTHEDALSRALEDTFSQYVKMNKKIPPEVLSSIAGIEDLSKLSDSIAAHMTMSLKEKQDVLEITDTKKRVEYLMKTMEKRFPLVFILKITLKRVKKN